MKTNSIVAGQTAVQPRAVIGVGSDREHFVAIVAHALESSLAIRSNNEVPREIPEDLNRAPRATWSAIASRLRFSA